MNEVLLSPAFGHADRSNCERELIRRAGSIQPHGFLLVLDAQARAVLKISANIAALIGKSEHELLNRGLGEFGGNLQARVWAMLNHDLADPQPFQCCLTLASQINAEDVFEGMLHRLHSGEIVVELEPAQPADQDRLRADSSEEPFENTLAKAVERFSGCSGIVALSDAVVQVLRELAGYDRVMVYKFDPDGHGKIIAEARDETLDSLLGHHYPATDIPQRARELYLRTRVRVLVDVNYQPVAINPDGQTLDMSLCYLRSMSPLHLQYLKNMGVTATLVVSLVREGKLWGLIACHHHSPRQVSYRVRAACGLLAEAISTRITAIENYAHAQGVLLVRSLEQRLIEATSTDGDWRRALFHNPRTLLQPVDATGAVLFFEDQILTVGEVPSTPELRQLLGWVDTRVTDSIFCCSSVARENPALASMTPTASGVLAIALSSSRPDYLVWLRREQLSEVTWAGDPTKAVIDNDPLNLSPRRSFAAWSQIVRDSASPWSNAEVALARAIGTTLIDIILQIQAVRLLIAQHQLSLVRVTVDNSREPVVVADAEGRVLFSNISFSRLMSTDAVPLATLDELVGRFTDVEQARSMVRTLRHQRLAWRGELSFSARLAPIPVSVRADIVLGIQGAILGFILIFSDLSDSKKAEAAQRQLENALYGASRSSGVAEPGSATFDAPDDVVNSILANARLAALDIVDGSSAVPLAPLIEELETATRRAMAIYMQLQAYRRRDVH
jgi:light-regulated signal transduction histidine kinase (bacteriophytochrome)